MRQLPILLLAILMTKYSTGQITKHNWLVGGTGLFNSTTHTNDLGLQLMRYTNIQLSPAIGYLFVNKFAGGLKLSFATSRNKNISDGAGYNLEKNNSYGFGPFLRYYFLDTDKQFNILIDGSYQYQIERGGGVSSSGNTPIPVPITQYTKNTLSIVAGPVIYFNSSVGLEFLIGYTTSKYVQNKSSIKSVQVGLGFQIHLEKDK
jgi:hypothetical protein